jgi:hypothetical protein
VIGRASRQEGQQDQRIGRRCELLGVYPAASARSQSEARGLSNLRVWIEPVAKQLDAVVAIGDLYRFDRFAAPAKVWDDLQARFPELLNAS